jgi:hypothetical protein
MSRRLRVAALSVIGYLALWAASAYRMPAALRSQLEENRAHSKALLEEYRRTSDEKVIDEFMNVAIADIVFVKEEFCPGPLVLCAKGSVLDGPAEYTFSGCYFWTPWKLCLVWKRLRIARMARGPNQALEPTTLLVTNRACARFAPSKVVAHL